MEVKVEIDSDLTAPSVVVRVPAQTATTAQLVAAIQAAVAPPQQLVVTQRGRRERIAVATILFCEATGHQVAIHTANRVVTTHVPLYQLAAELPATFVRASKSAVVNVQQIATLSKSLTGNLIQFQQSHKQLYVSRRYYGAVKHALERKE
ncbi:LytTR family DNA-binding domain-containing protein [Levilactobacillus namurensis]|uniref:LytTR family DNA-binding domain-containing protein n=1 Tax=Levilactobacillus namurensis TaxID=380393 RepID=UPI00223154E4|nr:LytTR family DNA-binding domain-containing protein [Levilactobacillus namurensis]MCW3779539.1 LytTR family transcriptional regulator [Levilactobacillus namurensis]MDT7018033.1 LytTR family DNA-binding domain-containing protein [Levilactobacillus namurensis]WNN64974.1 LytTR family DNA-binding domain-containing protein [Levilactobacillus namurensis]